MLFDNGREFCGRPDRDPYELFLQLEEIEHCTTKVRRPPSNGFVERLHRTLLDEHFRVMGRKKFYDSIEAMQKDLDAYLFRYNTERPNQGRGMKGRTPAHLRLPPGETRKPDGLAESLVWNGGFLEIPIPGSPHRELERFNVIRHKWH